MATGVNNGDNGAVRFGVMSALLAACFFGIGAPISKLLLRGISPLTLAGLLYIGSFAGLLVITLARGLAFNGGDGEARLRGRDYLYFAGSLLAGGVAAPALLMYGLLRTSGSVTSLLLNTEGVLTTLIAMLVFKEHVGRRIWAAAVLMLAAGAALTYAPGDHGWSFNYWSILVVLSALMWAVDNNLTKQLSHRDPFVIAKYKGLIAGAANLLLAAAADEGAPAAAFISSALLFGALGYGASLVLFIYALRNLGASRTITYFGAAPFMGVAASVLILGEPVTVQILFAGTLMAAGLWIILREYHGHEHTHDAFCHEHGHVHDEHHGHRHDGEFTEPHCHEHEHAVLTHSHAHVPDIHHYHKH